MIALDPFAAPCTVCQARSGEQCDTTLYGRKISGGAGWSVHSDRKRLAQVQQFGYDALEIFELWDNNGLWHRYRGRDGRWVFYPA